jgi:hypothetical protein
MRSLIFKLIMLATFLAGPLLAPCGGQVTLAWNPSPTPGVAGYYLCWGTSSGVYTSTNVISPGTQTTGIVSGLVTGQIYYLAAQSFMSNGMVSPFSNEAIFTNGAPVTQSTNGPPVTQSTNGSPVTQPISSAAGHSQVSLAWNPSPTLGVAGYYLCWGTSSGVYTSTNVISPGTQTTGIASNLASGQVYYLAAQSFMSNGMVSPFSNEATFTNGPPSPNSIFVVTTNAVSQGDNGNGSSGNVTMVSGNGAGSSSIGAPTNSEARIWGIPPFLTMTITNGQAKMNIGATVGATLMIQATTNLLAPDSWETMTNVTLTQIAPAARSNQTSQASSILNTAFVPAAQELPISSGNSTSSRFYRVVMPYDYVILASIVLKDKGYTPRLIVVNMPGILCDDACYVNEVGSFIHYNWANSILQLEGSRPSIRQIANTLAKSLNLAWVSASEFTYSNGLGQILATVVETEPPSSDPVAGQNPPSPPMVIDF